MQLFLEKTLSGSADSGKKKGRESKEDGSHKKKKKKKAKKRSSDLATHVQLPCRAQWYWI